MTLHTKQLFQALGTIVIILGSGSNSWGIGGIGVPGTLS